MKRLFAALAIVCALITVAFADPAYRLQIPLGYVQFTSVSTSSAVVIATSAPSSGVTGIPAGANSIVVYVEGSGIRWRDDGTAPTSSVGNPVAAGQAFFYSGALPKFQFIGQTGSPTVNVTYYD